MLLNPFTLEWLLLQSSVINLRSDSFGKPIFQKSLQN